MKIHNVLTNLVGRTKTERIVDGATWDSQILPVIQNFLKQNSKSHKSLIGQWVVELIGNDEHMHEFFSKNWKTAAPNVPAVIHCYVITGLKDKQVMMALLGLKTPEDVCCHRDRFIQALADKKFRAGIRDPELSNIEKVPDEKQQELALFSPATVYCSETHSFLTLNTNYYGQLKSKSSLGPLEEYLIRKAKMDAHGRLLNPEEVWLSMHAGCNEYATDHGKKRGIVLIAPTGTGKSTHGYGLVEAKKQNKLHSDDWVFVNVKTREVIISEERYYMRTNIAEIYPHLIPLLVNEPLENVAFTPEMVALLEKFKSPKDLEQAIAGGRVTQEQYRKIVEQMIENNSSRSLIDPRIMVGDKFTERTQLTDFFLMKRDYDSLMLVQKINPAHMIEILTSAENVFNYTYGKKDLDGYGIAQSRSTEIYYNPYLCVCEVDRAKNSYGPLDRIRIESYRLLSSHPDVRTAWINTRLPVGQMQTCLRRYLEEDYDLIEVQKGEKVSADILKRLNLTRKSKPPLEGRRAVDLTGFFTAEDKEVEIVFFFREGQVKDIQIFPKEAVH